MNTLSKEPSESSETKEKRPATYIPGGIGFSRSDVSSMHAGRRNVAGNHRPEE
jgi:hypothetical protein